MNISVIIPVYNEEKYIGKCLETLLNQTIKPYEIIVVNNNSRDNSAQVVKKYPVTLINEEEQGMIPARNTGFNYAKGDIFARCDADSHLPPNWIERIQTDFEHNSIDAVSGPTVFYDIPMTTIGSFIATFLYFKLSRLILGHNVVYGPNMAISRKIWNVIAPEICMDSNKVHEDADLSVHMGHHKGRIMYDRNLTSYISARRLKENPYSGFVEYPIRWVHSLKLSSHNFK